MNNFNKQFIIFICLVSAMGGLLFGYDWVVIGGAKPFYEVFFGIEAMPSQQGLAMSIALVGCMIGALTQGWMADRWGRKPLLIASAVIFLASAVMTGAVSNFSLFLFARFLGGIGIGVASGLSPMYIAEVSPSHIRGRLVSLNQMTIVLGILGAQIVNMLIARDVTSQAAADILASWNGQMAWRWMFWAEALPAVVFLVMAFFIPESPTWQLLHGQADKARATYARIGGDDYAKEMSEERRVKSEERRGKSEERRDKNEEIRGKNGDSQSTNSSLFTQSTSNSQSTNSSLFTQSTSNSQSTNSSLFTLHSSLPLGLLLLGVFIAVFQQWCGTNVIFNYAQEIFQAAGYEIGDVLFNIVVTGVANVVFTVVAIFTVDRLGRRSLMLIGAGGLCLIYGIMGYCYYQHITGMVMIVLTVAAISCYAMTLGPCTWVLISELFPARVRSLAVAICTFALWIGSTTLTYTFPLLNSSLGSYGTFWIYSAICLVGFVVLFMRLPETKGRPLG